MPPPSPTLGASGLALLGLAIVCWLICLLFVFSVAGKDVHGDAVVGQAYAWFAAMGFGALTWLWIGGLLLKAGTEDVLQSGGIALVLYLASGLGGAVAVFLITDDMKRVWPAGILVLLPAILIFYVFGLYQHLLRPFLLNPLASVLVAGSILLLSAAPLPTAIPKLFRHRESTAVRKQAMDAQTREANLAKLEAMSADAPLWAWFDLLHENSGVRPEAVQAVRKLERRQKDLEDALDAGVPMALGLIPDLDVQATPRLCEAAGNYLRKYAKETRVRPKQDPREYSGTWVQDSLPALRWLMSHGCDCDETVAAMVASVKTFKDTPARTAALAALSGLRQKDSSGK